MPPLRDEVRYPLTAAHFEPIDEAEPVESDVRLEAAAADFEVDRAMTAYIPLLTACYALANGEPFGFPDHYRSLGEIRVDRDEISEASDSPEVAEAIQNDVAATEAAVVDPDAFGFVVLEEQTGHVLVCIRGTQTPREWAANFTAVPNPFSLAKGFGLVHLGFERMHRSVRKSIERGLQQVPADRRVTVVGHSLGGAMATLAAVDIHLNFKRPDVDVCTFGGPRVGKFIFRRKFNGTIPRCFRVTNQGDIVPHVPPMLTGWSHTGEEIEVDANMENPHSLVAYLEGLRHIETVREIAPAADTEEAALGGVYSVRVS